MTTETAEFHQQTVTTTSEPDASEAQQRAHDRWFREQVAQAMREADDPTTQWVSNEAMKDESAARRAAWRKRASEQSRGSGGA